MDNDKQLDSFDPAVRRHALERLADAASLPDTGKNAPINMHQHSFFSYNYRGYSPSHLAWESRKTGLYATGLCDFDVLDGLEEFLSAGFLLGLRTAVSMETRAFLREYAEVDINSPGEPGVIYIMGSGFAADLPPDSPCYPMLMTLRNKASERNGKLIARINASIPEIAIDYDKDVVSLSPGGCPTERHIILAYRTKTESVFGKTAGLKNFLSGLFKSSDQETERMIADIPALEEKLRSSLAKKGGIGYEQPTENTFPPADDFIKWTLSCGAIPVITWLDGTSPGEKDTRAMLECMTAKGAGAVNIIPDRNHNISDENERRIKLEKLDEIVCYAREMQLPVIIGTEMNKAGQPFADNINTEPLSLYKDDFVRGARIITAHTLLVKFAGYSYTGKATASEFGDDKKAKNRFFEKIGSLPPLVSEQACAMTEKGHEKAITAFRDSARSGTWKI